MEKRHLVDLLHHYSGSSFEEAAEVISMRNQYPYSQVLQALSARVSKDHNLENQQTLLQSAAVYSTDRSVLKEIMSKAYEAAFVQQGDTKISSVTTTANLSPEIQKTIDSIDYADEIIHDLEKLNELKHNFEALAAGFGNLTIEKSEATPKRKPPGRPKKNVEVLADPLIDDISSKKKIDPESPKTIEQIAIIDQFIKAQPSIKPKATPVAQNDLADIKSGEFSDTIISETLAKILIRQGKKEKAIEVYRKLIWKFPQKKAYFAAQIEELKK